MKLQKYWSQLISTVIWKNRAITIGVSSIALMVIVQWIAILSVSAPQSFVAWHYTVYFGIDRIGPQSALNVYPIVGTVMAIINTLIIIFMYYRRRLFAYVFTIGTCIAEAVIILQIGALLWFIV